MGAAKTAARGFSALHRSHRYAAAALHGGSAVLSARKTHG